LTYGYNNNGWLTWRRQWTTGSTYQQTAYSYDPNGNLTFINYPAGTTDVSLAYDALDRVTQMIDAAGTTTRDRRPGRRTCPRRAGPKRTRPAPAPTAARSVTSTTTGTRRSRRCEGSAETAASPRPTCGSTMRGS
jgi:YD repeat-containing protein